MSKKEPKVLGYWLQQGWAWNPLLKAPRNGPCPCLSGIKFKKCHAKNMPRALNVEKLKTLLKETK